MCKAPRRSVVIPTSDSIVTLDHHHEGVGNYLIGGSGEVDIGDGGSLKSTAPSVSIGGPGNDTFVFHPREGTQTVNNFNPQNDTIELDHCANIQNVQELAAAITPDVHGNAVLELGHGDSVAIPGVTATFLQQNLESLVHLHA